MRGNARRIGTVARRWAARAALAVAAALPAYLAAGLAGGAVPVNAGWRPPARGAVRVWVEGGGVHTGLVVPKVAAGVDWRPLVRADDLADPRHGGWDHLALGWGERGFYLGTPRWSDLRLPTVLKAALGSGRTLIHAEHVPRPTPGDGARAVDLRPAEYRRLAAFIRASFAPRGARLPGYGRDDAFYEARGRYSAGRTCNSWTGEALARAGVRVGWWTPFPTTVLWWFPATGREGPER